MNNIFISYSRKDEIFARLLATDLERMGGTIWIDVDNIPIGSDWRNEIQVGLKASDILVLIVSPDSMLSREVKKEWSAFYQEKKPIIPVVLRSVSMMPEELEHLNYVDFEMQKYTSARIALQLGLVQYGFELKVRELVDRNSVPILRHRHEQDLNVTQMATNATDIAIIAVSSTRIGVDYGFLKSKLMSGCSVSTILLNPMAKEALQTFNIFAKWDHTKTDIESKLDEYERLSVTGKCEVRLIDYYVPYSMVAVNIEKPNGLIRISLFGFKRTGDTCPQLLLTSQMDWYDFYVERFRSMWKAAEPHIPRKSEQV